MGPSRLRLLSALLCAVLIVPTAVSAGAAGADNTLTLHLHAGLHGPGLAGSFAPPTAADIPPGVITLTVPLYPGAMPTTETESQPTFATAASPYLKSDGAAYLLPTDPVTALSWYRQAFQAAGYTVSGSSSAGSLGASATSQGITFASTAISATSLTVQLSLQADAQGQTIVYYEAQAIAVPSRDPATLLPATVVRVAVSYHLPLGTLPPDVPATVTARRDVQTLVDAFDALPRDTGEVHGCALDRGEGATLTFVQSDGVTLTASIDPACSSVSIVGYPGLSDQGGQLWNAVRAVVGPRIASLAARQDICAALQARSTPATCYRPAQLPAALRRLSIRPFNPITAVGRALHLTVMRVIVLSGPSLYARQPSGAIAYIFGAPARSGAAPRYAAVLETANGAQLQGPIQGFEVEPAASWVSGLWSLDAVLPGGHLALHIDSNSGKSALLALGQRFMAAARQPAH